MPVSNHTAAHVQLQRNLNEIQLDYIESLKQYCKNTGQPVPIEYGQSAQIYMMQRQINVMIAYIAEADARIV